MFPSLFVYSVMPGSIGYLACPFLLLQTACGLCYLSQRAEKVTHGPSYLLFSDSGPILDKASSDIMSFPLPPLSMGKNKNRTKSFFIFETEFLYVALEPILALTL